MIQDAGSVLRCSLFGLRTLSIFVSVALLKVISERMIENSELRVR